MSLKKTMAFTLVLLCLTSLGIIQCVKSQLTNNIFIHPDGSVSGTTKIQHNGNLYTLTDNIYDQVLVIECNNMIVDGAVSLSKEQAVGAWQEWQAKNPQQP